MARLRRCILGATALVFLTGMASEMPINGLIFPTREKLSGHLILAGARFSVELVAGSGAQCSGHLSDERGALSCSDGREGSFVLRQDEDRMRGDGTLGDDSMVLWFPAKPTGSD